MAKRRRKIVAGILFLAGVGISFLLIDRWKRSVDVELYTIPLSQEGIALEGNLLSLKERYGRHLRLAIHPIASLNAQGNLASLLADRAKEKIPKEVLALDLEEAKLQLLLKKEDPKKYLEYLKIRNSQPLNPDIGPPVMLAGFDQSRIKELLNGGEGESFLRREISEFRKRWGEESSVAFPFLAIAGKPYRGSPDFLALASAVAKPLIRRNRDSLPPRGPLTFFGGAVSIRHPFPYQYKGFSECYADSNCNDKSDRFGSCENAGTPYARCTYSPAPEVRLTVLSATSTYDSSKDPFISNIRADVKKLSIDLIPPEEKERRNEAREMFGIPESKAGDNALYLFDETLEKSPVFPLYKARRIIQETAPHKYRLLLPSPSPSSPSPVPSRNQS